MCYVSFEGGVWSGSIPPLLRSLTALKELTLRGNELTGAIPLWIGQSSRPFFLLLPFFFCSFLNLLFPLRFLFSR